ncbi:MULTISPECIES: CerR family C-terminal domain-containing protein [Alphaproteobacteria]|uniref:TetR family transcriptional regulator n=2 Tax=Alphaproteobacteria TaxID=28211 RepID=A0A512HEU0_9HYPH|nr:MULTISPECIES: CerR family C-terminal domain-containing protein [Alphaproteobacteria]GEO83972.1 TetR family transcriptional regulator [Ciceribacter naphthalenivorans]GLR21150.1 TetR family transcriptional regulator [Ciceribacter naphthalenivorans]GLT04006.1 TetR family transcriptional regulator [Sphingomonas psychrolutea]
MARALSGAAATRRSLISAALELFGNHGYEAVSTRQIADHAAANIGSIAYHFGGKPGLRNACIGYVIDVVLESLGPALTQSLPANLTPDEALDMLDGMIATMMRIGASRPDADLLTTFMNREMVMPGEVDSVLYERLAKPIHERSCQLFAIAVGRPGAEDELALTVFSLFGQSVFFRICKSVLVEHMGWRCFGLDEMQAAIAVFSDNLRAIVIWHRGRNGA